MTFNFDNSKKLARNKKDKSNIQKIDEKIASLCLLLNNHNDYFTTSSCSGRIVIVENEEKKQPDLFLFRTHELISFEECKKVLEKITIKSKKLIMFKQEPPLIVVACRNKESQWKLFSLARNNGWKKSGILSIDKKLLIELFSTEQLSFPIIDNGKILVSDDFLKVIVEKANKNLERGWKKIEKLMNTVKTR